MNSITMGLSLTTAEAAKRARAERVEGVNAVSAEKLLEDVLARSPDVLMEGLTIVGRQNDTEGARSISWV